MRDMLILAALVVTFFWSLKRPWIGVMCWTLVSLMSPHIQWGYAAADWPVATGYAAAVLIGLAITKDRQTPMIGAGAWLLLLFSIWITITLPFSIYFDSSYPLWVRSMKIFLMAFVTMALITDRHKLEVFIWICVVSIAYYGVKGGVFSILTGGNNRVWGPGGFIEGNNEVGLAVIVVIPLMRYLQQQMTDKRKIVVMSVAMLLCAVTVLGTHSRGALLGLLALGLYFWLKSDRKVIWGAAIVIIGMLLLSIMPDAWWDRMNTINTYKDDASAMGRINAWHMAFNLARDRFFGGGFMVWTGAVFQKYAPDPDDPHAAHSIYFQILGEHGFVGLFLFLSMGVATWFTAAWLSRTGKRDPRFKWAAELGPMIQVSMVGYAITGAFLSLAYYDLPYNVMIMAMLAKRFVLAEMARKPLAASQPMPAMPEGGAANLPRQQVRR